MLSRRKKTVDSPTVGEPESQIVEEASPSAIVAEVLEDLIPQEVVATHPKASGKAGGTQSFAFDTMDEELPMEAPVEQLVEAT